jgi:putative Mn2+ efflux pump MntP
MVIEGVKEWREKLSDNNETAGVCPYPRQQLTLKKLTLQAVATSIDALAVGVTLKMATMSDTGLAFGVWGATAVIGVITFALSFASVFIGKKIGDKLADKAGLFGGLVLLGIGIKILIEGLL